MPASKESFVEILIKLPWWVSATLGFMVFIGLRWIFPHYFAESPLTAAFAAAVPRYAVVPALFFLGIAGISAFYSARKRRLVDSQQSLESLRELSWQQFEWMVAEAYQRQGYHVDESIRGGADGGVDVVLKRDGGTYLVQCKNWKSQSVGVPIVREQLGLLTHHKADGSIIITSGKFTRDAVAFAEANGIQLIDGPALLDLVKSVQRNPLSPSPPAIEPIEAPHTPICPLCGNTMVLRKARRGTNAGNAFWGCSTYPKCRGTMKHKDAP